MTRRWNPHPGGPTGLLGRSDSPGKMTNERPLKDKHLCLLTLHVNFITKLLTPTTVGARTSLEGFRECLLVYTSSSPDPSLCLKTGDMGCGCKTLSKTRRTARPYAPTAMVFLFTRIIEFTVPHTPSFCIRLLEKGSEGPPADSPSRRSCQVA